MGEETTTTGGRVWKGADIRAERKDQERRGTFGTFVAKDLKRILLERDKFEGDIFEVNRRRRRRRRG